MNKKVLIFLTITSLLIFLIGCTSQTKNHDIKDSKIEELQSQVKSYELDLKILKEEKDGYKKFINSSIKYLNDSELLELAKKEWRYSIRVDEKPVESNDVLRIDKRDFKITYSEAQSAFPALAPQIHNKGSISGNFFNHIKILDIKPNNIYPTDGTVVQGIVYEFKDVHKGKTIKLQISNELKERLSLKTNIVTIQVR